MKDDLYFVGIPDATELRKELLTSSKTIITILKRQDHYAAIKAKKQHAISDLKRAFDELMVMNKKLRNKLPEKAVKMPKKKKEERPAKKAIPKSKLDKLEHELAKIEERLGSLE